MYYLCCWNRSDLLLQDEWMDGDEAITLRLSSEEGVNVV